MPQMTVDQAMQIASQHHQAGSLQQAEVIYRQVLAQQPAHPDALHHLGLIAHQVGRNDIAVDLIRRAIALRPSYAEAHSNLGNALKAAGELNQAIAAFRQAIALKPTFAEAHCNLSNALRDKGQFDEAVAAARQAIALRPNLPEAHNNLGNALKDSKNAIAAYRQAIALRPSYAQAYSNLGGALRERRLFDDAVAACRRAIDLEPNLPEAHFNLGAALLDQGQIDQAIAAYRQAIALRPSLTDAYYSLGHALAKKGQLDWAVSVYRQAIAVQTGCANHNLVLALTRKEQADQAAVASGFARNGEDPLAPRGTRARETARRALENVTLLCIDCIDPAAAARVLERSSDLGFGAVKLLSHEAPTRLANGIEWVHIPRIASLWDYSLFAIRQLNRHIETSHVLSIQTDGFILEPENWNNDWLQYDYIGAPWVEQSWNKTNRVGNGGFCLRSRRLLDATAGWTEQQLERYRSVSGFWQDDVITCCAAFDDLTRAGMRFAPLTVAAAFSFEEPIAELAIKVDEIFGFHKSIYKLR
jgi:tetratricopeptide (TPR) repeat protein